MMSREEYLANEERYNRDNYPAEPYIDPEEYQGFDRLFHAGGFPHLRYGQAFFNKYGREQDHPVATLFYAQDIKAAKEIIEQHYVKWA